MLASNDTILHCTIPHHLGDWKAFRSDHVAGLIKATEWMVYMMGE
jgi:hypothetical protein